MELRDITIEKDFIKKILANNEWNEIIQVYYRRLAKETGNLKLLNNEERLGDCNKWWLLDRYDVSEVKDFKKTNLCKDKFCNNCKKVKQASRMGKFIPLLRPFRKNMYQLTLTVPNVSGDELPQTIKQLFSSFTRLIEYLKLKKKIRGIDFEELGYKGAIRSLEVTYKGDSYHPHLHALIVLEGDPGLRHHKNAYSIDHKKGRDERLFSDNEILIQKIWYLLNNKITVTKKTIDELEIGYSCTLDKFQESDFIELFKYMTKATTEDAETLTYNQFKTLYVALKNVRQIQGYGCFYGLKDEEINMDEVNELYNNIVAELQQKESPVEVCESPTRLLDDKKYTLISRKKVYSYLKRNCTEKND